MPSMANITVKKNDGTTDVTYTAQVASAGDKSAALWRDVTTGAAPGHNPSYQMTSRSNGALTARRVDTKYVYPQTATATDGSVQIVNQLILESSGVIPQGMPTASINEGCSQGLNLLSATLSKDSFKAGFAPT